ncbi:MAG: hypothetical protein HC855_11510 [Rhizobiales bacterium]|nr:hypothetical protein [Hyphomicrobiales bacterium]
MIGIGDAAPPFLELDVPIEFVELFRRSAIIASISAAWRRLSSVRKR